MSDNPLQDFARDDEPSPALRRRVERTLIDRGHLTPARTPWRALGIAASLLVAAGVGFAAGRIQPSPDSSPQFLLLLREDSTYRDDRPIREIVREYGRWADSLRQNDQLVLAEKLSNESADVVGQPVAFITDPRESPTTGLFLVRASNLDAAKAIAASSPHVKYGGRVVIRPIQRTR